MNRRNWIFRISEVRRPGSPITSVSRTEPPMTSGMPLAQPK